MIPSDSWFAMVAFDTTPGNEIERAAVQAHPAPVPTLRGFHVGIAAKITLWAIVLCAVSAGTASFFMYRGSERILYERQAAALSYSVGLAAQRVTTRFDTGERDVTFLRKTPAIESFADALVNAGVDPVDQATMPIVLDRIATLFSALAEARQFYFKVRLLGPTGTELVRIDRSLDGKVTRIAPDQLQEKGDRPFFTEPARLAAGQVYLSPIDLNQELGKIETPHRPTARVATPLRSASGALVGVIVLNLEMNSLFDLIDQIVGAGNQVFITNENGDYLANSLSKEVTFGFEFGKSYRLPADVSGFGPLYDGGSDTVSGTFVRPSGDYLGFGQRIGFDPDDPSRFMVIGALASSDDVLGRIRGLRDDTAWIVVAVVFGGALLAVLLAQLIVRPLTAMTAAATRIAEGGRNVDVTDLTRRGDEAGELARAVTVMLKEIGEREDRLTAQTQELSRSNQELAQFAYVASHDLQEPLRMVGSYLELLARRYEGKLDDEAHEFIGFAVDGATRMKRLINDLLGYSRAGNTPLKLETVEASDIVRSVLASLSLQIEEGHAAISVGKLPVVRVDPVQYGRIFQNLIENALKYRSPETPVVTISADRAENGWRFAVADNGIGIDPIFRDKIFEIFKRLHGRERYSGTGIGLAVTKLVVERHGGRIWVEPHKGGGSVFYFTLPDRKDA